MANRFTGLQQAFIDAFVGEAKFNRTKAARIAGYTGNGHTLSQRGYELVNNSEIWAEIRSRLEEQAMTSSELLKHLGNQGRVEVEEYYDEQGNFNLAQFKKDGHSGLIKTIKPGKYGPTIEFHDKLKSQELIGRHLALFTDKSEVVEIDGGSLVDFEDWKKSQENREAEAMETLEQFDDSEN